MHGYDALSAPGICAGKGKSMFEFAASRIKQGMRNAVRAVFYVASDDAMEIANKGVKVVSEKFSVEEIARKHIEVYQKVLARDIINA